MRRPPHQMPAAAADSPLPNGRLQSTCSNYEVRNFHHHGRAVVAAAVVLLTPAASRSPMDESPMPGHPPPHCMSPHCLHHRCCSCLCRSPARTNCRNLFSLLLSPHLLSVQSIRSYTCTALARPWLRLANQSRWTRDDLKALLPLFRACSAYASTVQPPLS